MTTLWDGIATPFAAPKIQATANELAAEVDDRTSPPSRPGLKEHLPSMSTLQIHDVERAR
jgi:hypothetical protein